MNKIYTLLLCFSFFSNLKNCFSQCTSNYLTNPSFESPVQTNIGNNLTGLFTFNGWTMTGGPFNVIKTNGTAYGGGPDNAQDGTQYIDVTSAAGTVYQDFTITCTTDITYGGYFSRREVGGADFTSFIEIINTSTNAIIGTSNILIFTNATNQETWFNATGTITALAPGNYRYRATIADYCNFDNALLCLSTPCILPIKFSNFKAAYNNCSSILNWSVNNESTIKYFDIEYSENGINFSKIGNNQFINNTLNYNFIHTINTTKSYYRIKGIELNGATTYSKIIALNTNCEKDAILIYPNPVANFLNISITNNDFKKANFELFDCNGRLLQNTTLEKGSNELNMQNLQKGMYYIRLKINNKVSKYSIIKI